jgi:hydrogenase maturation protein HypF
VEGCTSNIAAFTNALKTEAPSAARISDVETRGADLAGFSEFTIRESESAGAPSVRISPDLPVCGECLIELFNRNDPRYLYPYINCTNCGPRYTLIESLPYDRARTTMRRWPLCDFCAAQYHDPADRRFHAQPVACRICGPYYYIEGANAPIVDDRPSIDMAVRLLRSDAILAIKGIGGYHLSCDAMNETAVNALRERKFRKEKPFAVMVRDIDVARHIVHLNDAAGELLCSIARPIVLAPAKIELPGVAPDNSELGVMLPYAPLHHLLFAFGAPEVLVMTSANRSSEPICYRDDDARERLTGLADFFLIGERPIARRVDDSVARAGALGPVILRRSRGYAPAAVTTLPTSQPILALGADLKNTVTLVVEGQAFVSQHIGDLDHYEAFTAFRETIRDLLDMYDVDRDRLIIAHDLHPQYQSTLHAAELPACKTIAVQHHRAHVCSVMAERQAWNRRALGIIFDGTGYGDDATIWGGEFFTGSVAEGWTHAAHMRTAWLPGGDAAARYPVQCAAGFLAGLNDLPDLSTEPFCFPDRYRSALQLVHKRTRTFTTSSIGRLFDTVAALLGFTREVTFEGQAATWLEQLARQSTDVASLYAMPVADGTLDFRPLLAAIIHDRLSGTYPARIARNFHHSVAFATAEIAIAACATKSIDLVVMSGGVFQNELLVTDLSGYLENAGIEVWTNHAVPPNDGGVSLGQAACAALATANPAH